MIKYSDIRIGDYLKAEYEGKMWEGEVVNLNGDEKQVCVQTGVQEFWFETDHLHPIELNEEALLKLAFQKTAGRRRIGKVFKRIVSNCNTRCG